VQCTQCGNVDDIYSHQGSSLAAVCFSAFPERTKGEGDECHVHAIGQAGEYDDSKDWGDVFGGVATVAHDECTAARGDLGILDLEDSSRWCIRLIYKYALSRRNGDLRRFLIGIARVRVNDNIITAGLGQECISLSIFWASCVIWWTTSMAESVQGFQRIE